MDEAGAVRVPGDDLHAGKFVHAVLLAIFLKGTRGGLAIGHDEGKLECFGRREAARRIADDRPYQVYDVVLGLVEELRRRAAQRHGVVEFDLDTAAAIGLDLLSPGRQRLGRDRRLRWQHLMQPQGDVLRYRRDRHRAERDGREHE